MRTMIINIIMDLTMIIMRMMIIFINMTMIILVLVSIDEKRPKKGNKKLQFCRSLKLWLTSVSTNQGFENLLIFLIIVCLKEITTCDNWKVFGIIW